MPLLLPPRTQAGTPVGVLLDRLGIRARLGPADTLRGAVVILETVHGTVRYAASPGLSWSDQLGLLDAAKDQIGG
jgi:hypothetical protein